MNYKTAPKIELHLHLDCSLSFEVVNKINPNVSYEEYQESFIAPPKCTNLLDYISRAIKGYELMQTEEQLRLVTFDLCKQLHKDNVIYAEIRFAPLQHTLSGLTGSQVVEIVNKAINEGMSKYDLKLGVILCTLRHFSEAQSLETVKLVHAFEGSNVVGFDIASDEAGYPIDNHVSSFDYARTNNIKCTAHAGEARGADSVWETLKNFRPSRIGHGVRSVEDLTLLNYLKENNIHLEVCPTSNVQTNTVETIYDHPADKIFNSDISMSINTDGRTISNVDLAHEYELMENIFKWKKNHFLKCNLEAIAHAFTNDEIKSKLKERILRAYS